MAEQTEPLPRRRIPGRQVFFLRANLMPWFAFLLLGLGLLGVRYCGVPEYFREKSLIKHGVPGKIEHGDIRSARRYKSIFLKTFRVRYAYKTREGKTFQGVVYTDNWNVRSLFLKSKRWAGYSARRKARYRYHKPADLVIRYDPVRPSYSIVYPPGKMRYVRTQARGKGVFFSLLLLLPGSLLFLLFSVRIKNYLLLDSIKRAIVTDGTLSKGYTKYQKKKGLHRLLALEYSFRDHKNKKRKCTVLSLIKYKNKNRPILKQIYGEKKSDAWTDYAKPGSKNKIVYDPENPETCWVHYALPHYVYVNKDGVLRMKRQPAPSILWFLSVLFFLGSFAFLVHGFLTA